MRPEVVDPPTLYPVEQIGIAHAVRSGNTLYISGQVSVDDNLRLVGEGDIEVQTEQAFGCIRRILEAVGGSLDDIVKITVFLVRAEDFPAMARVRRRIFGRLHRPASSAIVVKELVVPGALVEIEAVAVLGDVG